MSLTDDARERELAVAEAFVRQAGDARQFNGKWFGERDGVLTPLALTNVWARAGTKRSNRKRAEKERAA